MRSQAWEEVTQIQKKMVLEQVLQQIVVFLFPLQFEQAQELFLLLPVYMSEEVAQEAPDEIRRIACV